MGKETKDFFEEKINALSKETKQDIMNLLMDDHLNIGQIKNRLNLETGVVAGVIVRQIQTAHYLKKGVA